MKRPEEFWRWLWAVVLVVFGAAALAADPPTAWRQAGSSTGRSWGTTLQSTALPTDSQQSGGELQWRTYDIAPALRRLERPEDTEILAAWVERFAAAEITSASQATVLVDGQKLIVRATPTAHAVVEELVDRLVRPPADEVLLHLQVAEAVDPIWRRAILRELGPPVSGPAGQALWRLSIGQSNVVRSELAAQRRRVPDIVAGSYRLRHGVPAIVEYFVPVPYTKGIEPDGATAYAGYAPVMDQVDQGLRMVLLPVWRKDLTHVDLLCRIELRTVRRLHNVNTTLQVPGGAQPVTVQVPEVGEQRWEIAVAWRTAQTLLISLGMHPAIQSTPPAGSLPALTRPHGELLILASLRPPVQSTVRRATPRWQRR